MALFYFHMCDGIDRLLDPEGREIAEVVLIPDIALREPRAIISHEALLGSILWHRRSRFAMQGRRGPPARIPRRRDRQLSRYDSNLAN